MQHRRASIESTVPGRGLRLLIEDPEVLDAPGWPAHLDVTVCSGPSSVDEVCRLVTDGACPLGDFHAVVTALQGPWAAPVHRAWQVSTTPVVDAADCTVTEPTARLTHHVGAVLQALWPPEDE